MPKIPPAPASAESGPQSEEELQRSIAQRYDQLNVLWSQAETSLKQFMVPHNVEYTYHKFIDDDRDGHREHGIHTYMSIAWAKPDAGAWRLCHGMSNDMYPDETYWKPITDCTVDRRLSLIKHFPKLREMVIEAARKNVSELDKAISEFREVLK